MRRRTLQAATVAATCFAAVILWSDGAPAAALRIGGWGSALAAVQAVSTQLAADDPDFRADVWPGLGTMGGLLALQEGAIDLTLAGRRLRPEERAKGMIEAACANTALAFASSLTAPAGLARADLPRLFADVRPAWPDGSQLSAAVPGLGAAFELARKRPWVPVSATDQENVDLAERIAGSLAMTTLLQMRAERPNLRVLILDGVAPTEATIADQTYPLIMPFCLIHMASPPAAAFKFLEHFSSPAGQALLRSFDTTPAD
ncbi:MAG: hypothetical protein EXQ95_12420 [Alphaproteobacteria bacterium]|nr:hypothetical protein [Alphaproteobacteria bacterium]